MKSRVSDRFFRQVFIPVHRYLGLVLAAHFILLALTGSLLVYRHELDALLNPGLYRTNPAVGDVRFGPWVDAAAKSMPTGHQIYTLLPPKDADQPVYLRSIGDDNRIIEYFVDPATATVLGSRYYLDTFINQVFQLHAALLLRPYGGADAVGYSGLILLLMTASGLYLWWPRGQQRFSRALKIKRRLRNLPLLLQWHNLPGAYAAVVVILVTISGVYLSFPGAFATATRALMFDQTTPPAPPTIAPYASRKSIDEAWNTASAILPGATIMEIYLPTTPEETYQFNMKNPGDAVAYGANQIYVDPGTGEVIRTRLVEDMSAADQLLSWQPSLHDGAIAGPIGRFLVFLSGFAMTALAITGWLIWLRKRRNRQRSTTTPNIRSAEPKPITESTR